MITELRAADSTVRSLAGRAVGLAVALRVLGLVVFSIAAGGVSAVHRRLERWDANWYAGIAEHGYGFVRTLADGRRLSDEAFFPLYPALERAAQVVTGLPVKDAGLLVSALALPVAAWGVYAVGTQLAGPRPALVLTGLWAGLPTALVLSLAYSEALFVALAAWSLHAVLRRRWLAAAVLAVLAGLTRPIGAAVAAAVIVGAAVEVVRGRRSAETGPVDRRAYLAAVVAPLGWLGYVVWLAWRHHDLLRYFTVQDGWGNGFDGGRAFAGWIGRRLVAVDRPGQMLAGVALLAGVAVVGWLFVLCVRDRQPWPVLAYTAAIVFLALTTARYFGSKPRYLLPAFPLLLPVAVRLARLRPARRAPAPLAAGAVGLLVVAAAIAAAAGGAASLLGSGPP